jgi:hypothetical protein
MLNPLLEDTVAQRTVADIKQATIGQKRKTFVIPKTAHQNPNRLPKVASFLLRRKIVESKNLFTCGCIGLFTACFTLMVQAQSLQAVERTAKQGEAPVKLSLTASSLRAIQSGIKNFDPVTLSGTIAYKSFPQTIAPSSFDDEFLNKKLKIRLIHAEPIKQSSFQTLYFFSSLPDDHDCHPCAPLISAMLVKQAPSGHGAVQIPLTPLERFGSFGKYDMKYYPPKVVAIGKNKTGFILRDSSMNQGYEYEWVSLYAIEGAAIKRLLVLTTLGDSTGSGHCDEEKPGDCINFKASYDFIHDAMGEYFPIRIRESGYKEDEKTEAVVPATDTYFMKFDGRKYSRVN